MITPWYVGKTAPIWNIALVPDSGVLGIGGLSPTNFSLLIKNLDTGDETAGQGTFSNLVAATINSVTGAITTPTSIQYQLVSADVTSPGNFTVAIIITLSDGQALYGPTPWEILPV